MKKRVAFTLLVAVVFTVATLINNKFLIGNAKSDLAVTGVILEIVIFWITFYLGYKIDKKYA